MTQSHNLANFNYHIPVLLSRTPAIRQLLLYLDINKGTSFDNSLYLFGVIPALKRLYTLTLVGQWDRHVYRVLRGFADSLLALTYLDVYSTEFPTDNSSTILSQLSEVLHKMPRLQTVVCTCFTLTRKQLEEWLLTPPHIPPIQMWIGIKSKSRVVYAKLVPPRVGDVWECQFHPTRPLGGAIVCYDPHQFHPPDQIVNVHYSL